MIQLKYSELMNPQLLMAMGKIMSTPIDQKAAYKAKKLHVAMKKLRDKVSDEYKKDVQPQFAVKDDKGEFNPEEFKCIEGKEAELEKAQDAFGERTAEIDWAKLTLADIKPVNQLTPMDLLHLEPLLDESEPEAPKVPEVPRALNAVK